MSTISYIAADKKITFVRNVQIIASDADADDCGVTIDGLKGFNRELVANKIKDTGLKTSILWLDKWDLFGSKMDEDYDDSIINCSIMLNNTLDEVLPVMVDLFKAITGNLCEVQEVGLKTEIKSYVSEWCDHKLPRPVIEVGYMPKLFQKWFHSNCRDIGSIEDYDNFAGKDFILDDEARDSWGEPDAVELRVNYYFGVGDVIEYKGEYETILFRRVALFKTNDLLDAEGEYLIDSDCDNYMYYLIEIVSIDGKAPEYEKAQAVSA